jgi:hypothetical protein
MEAQQQRHEALERSERRRRRDEFAKAAMQMMRWLPGDEPAAAGINMWIVRDAVRLADALIAELDKVKP